MVPADKSPIWDAFLHHQLRGLFRKQFHALCVAGGDQIATLPPDRPLVGIANHTNWWDGFLILFLTRWLPDRRHYIFVEERHMTSYPFLRKLGAFGVNLDDPRDGARALRYASGLMEDPRTMVWIFPQARMRPAREALRFTRGAELLIRRQAHCTVLPLAMRYEFTTEQHPLALCRFGQARENPGKITESLIADELAHLDQDVLSGSLQDYHPLIPPRVSLNKKWERWWLALRGKSHQFSEQNDYRP